MADRARYRDYCSSLTNPGSVAVSPNYPPKFTGVKLGTCLIESDKSSEGEEMGTNLTLMSYTKVWFLIPHSPNDQTILGSYL